MWLPFACSLYFTFKGWQLNRMNSEVDVLKHSSCRPLVLKRFWAKQTWKFRKKVAIMCAKDKLTTAANMIILLFASRRFSCSSPKKKEEICIKLRQLRMCFCSVVHSQHHCIVRVIKLLNKFHLSLRYYHFEWEARMEICSDTRRKTFFNTRSFSFSRSLSHSVYCRLDNFISPMRTTTFDKMKYARKIFHAKQCPKAENCKLEKFCDFLCLAISCFDVCYTL